MLLLFLALACQPVETASNEAVPVKPLQDILTLEQSPGVIGMWSPNGRFSVSHPSEYVLDDGHLYRGARHRIGSLNVITKPGLDTSNYIGELVLVQGRRSSSLYSALTDLGPAPEDYGQEAMVAQMRSDWVAPEGGYRSTRKIMENLPVFFANSVRPVNLKEEVKQTDDTTEVRITNPFNQPLAGLDVQAHYEGGPGKPMPRMRPVDVNIPPGGTQTLSLPTVIEELVGGRQIPGRFRLHSVDFKGTIGKTEVNFSVFIPGGPFKTR